MRTFFVFLFVFDKSVKMILEAGCLDCNDEFCSGAASEDMGVSGTAQILDTTKAEVWKNNVCVLSGEVFTCAASLLRMAEEPKIA